MRVLFNIKRNNETPRFSFGNIGALVACFLILLPLISSCALRIPAPVSPSKKGCVLRMGEFHNPLKDNEICNLAQPPDVVPGALDFEIPELSDESEDVCFTQEGLASWYDSKRRNLTASGERFSPTRYAAAHKTLPMGTWVEITNLENGKKCRVRINDRGPFIKGRVIDVTPKAASELDMVRKGIARVRVRVLEYPE